VIRTIDSQDWDLTTGHFLLELMKAKRNLGSHLAKMIASAGW